MANPTPSTETIMQRLFQIAQAVNTPVTPFKVMSRRMRHYKDVAAPEMPAFFQFQAPGRQVTGGDRGLPIHKIKAYWIVYLPMSQGNNDVVSPAMNNYYDALSNALLPPTTVLPNASRNTLGGLVTNCYEEGQGLMDEGLLATPSLIVIPITILTGVK